MVVETRLVFYDIASREPRTTFAPNPWKTRIALNLKGVSYRTEWIQMPDIAALRERLGVPANRTLPDGTPFPTLPVVQDLLLDKLVGDSFEIALYLDSAFPDQHHLISPSVIGLTAAFNAHADGIFTKFAGLCTDMPFDPTTFPKVQAMFASRIGGIDPTKVPQLNESQESKMLSFEAALGELAKAYRHTGGTTDYYFRANGTDQAQAQNPPLGREAAKPFLDGDEPTYADVIVTAWLKMCEISMCPEDWQKIRGWHGGLWGSIVDAMEPWCEIK